MTDALHAARAATKARFEQFPILPPLVHAYETGCVASAIPFVLALGFWFLRIIATDASLITFVQGPLLALCGVAISAIVHEGLHYVAARSLGYAAWFALIRWVRERKGGTTITLCPAVQTDAGICAADLWWIAIAPQFATPLWIIAAILILAYAPAIGLLAGAALFCNVRGASDDLRLALFARAEPRDHVLDFPLSEAIWTWPRRVAAASAPRNKQISDGRSTTREA